MHNSFFNGLWLVIGLLRINLSTNDKPGIFAA
jgi:hypothetical protein